MGNNCAISVNNTQDQQVFGNMEIQRQQVTYQTGRRGRRTVTCVQDVFVPSETSIKDFSKTDLDKRTIDIDGKIVSFKEYSKQNGGEFYVDGKGKAIYASSIGKLVLDPTKNEWVPMDKFYGDKAFDVNENLKHAQKASFIKDYGLVSSSNGKYRAKDSTSDARLYDFDLTGENLKVRLSGGLVKVDGKLVESKKPYIYEDGKWRIDENSGPVLREDLNSEIDARKTSDETLTAAVGEEVKARKSGDEILTTALGGEVKAREAGDGTLTTALGEEVKARKKEDEALTKRLSKEEITRQAEDKALTTKLDEEVKARKSGDETLTTALGEEIKIRKTSDETLTTALGEEIKIRKTSDETLTTALGEEIKARKAGDGTLTTVLGEEVKARKAGDGTLTTALGEEVKARKSGDEILTTALGGEVKAREAGDKTLSDKISKNGETDTNQDEQICKLIEMINELKAENEKLKERIKKLEP